MTFLFRSVTLITAVCATLTAHAALQSRLDSLFTDRYDNPDAPGGAVIVNLGDSTLYEAYFGIADMESGRQIDSATTFNIASVSKQFTVIGLLQLAAEEKVDIDDPLTNWFGDRFHQPFWRKVTPIHLASQSSGIPDTRDRSSRQACIFANDSTSESYFPAVDSLLFEPGTAYDYVNPTFILLARIIVQTTGQSFTDYQHEHIFEPAGMNSTYYFDPATTPMTQSHAYQPDSLGGWHEYDYGEETFFATRPDGGIYSTARDMARWEQALSHNSLLPVEWRDRAYTPLTDVASSQWCDYQRRPFTWYGLGWFVEQRPDQPVKIFHTGDNGGYQAYVAKYPEAGVSIIVLENRHDRPRRAMAEQIEKILTEEKIL